MKAKKERVFGLTVSNSKSVGNLEISRNSDWVKNYEKLLWQYCDGEDTALTPSLTNSSSSPCYFPNDVNLLLDEDHSFGFELFSMQGMSEELKKEIEEDDKLYDHSEFRFNIIPTPKFGSFDFFKPNKKGKSLLKPSLSMDPEIKNESLDSFENQGNFFKKPTREISEASGEDSDILKSSQTE
jgi:hypothetical protein